MSIRFRLRLVKNRFPLLTTTTKKRSMINNVSSLLCIEVSLQWCYILKKKKTLDDTLFLYEMRYSVSSILFVWQCHNGTSLNCQSFATYAFYRIAHHKIIILNPDIVIHSYNITNFWCKTRTKNYLNGKGNVGDEKIWSFWFGYRVFIDFNEQKKKKN